jgi:hypothetical protein
MNRHVRPASMTNRPECPFMAENGLKADEGVVDREPRFPSGVLMNPARLAPSDS